MSRLWDFAVGMPISRFGSIWADLGGSVSKSKLEKAIEEGISGLNDTQKQLVLAQFADWKRNKTRIAEIEDALRLGKSSAVTTSARNAQRAELVAERAQLIDVNGRILARLTDQLSDRH